MCGIAGILNIRGQCPIDRDMLCRMVSILRHRGPDESGIYIDSHIGLGHARLSVVGLKSGTQPICNEDGSLWIIYNGETYNYIELRQDLAARGHKFVTETDTEVVLHLFEELGPGCLQKMNGQFSFAIWSSATKELFLARDRVGIRPLYFCRAGGCFLFASEIKSLFLHPAVRREVSPESLAQVFTFWTTLGSKTIFRDIYQLPPGHFMVVKDGEIRQQRYWNSPFHYEERRWDGSFEEAKEELKSLLKDAVRLRLRADVPVGAYLSGGLDSTIITALIAKYFNNRLKTFSMVFEAEAYDERVHQQRVVGFLNTDHYEARIENSLIGRYLPDVIWHCEIPLLRTAPVPLFLLSSLVKKNNLKVVLTGEGADEVFGGYNIFKEGKVRYFWAKQPDSKLRALLLQRLYPYVFKDPSRGLSFLQKFYRVSSEDLKDPLLSHRVRWTNGKRNMTFFSSELKAAVANYDPLSEIFEGLTGDFKSLHILSRAQLLEMDIFLANYLLSSQGDRVAMANSVEIRLPYLDYRIIELAAKLPARWRLRGLNEKYILKQAYQGLIPEQIRSRSKQPYRAPICEALFDNPDGEYVEEALSETEIKKANYFDPQKAKLLVAKYRKKAVAVPSEVQNMALVGILTTQLLHKQFIEQFQNRVPDPAVPNKVVVGGAYGACRPGEKCFAIIP